MIKVNKWHLADQLIACNVFIAIFAGSRTNAWTTASAIWKTQISASAIFHCARTAYCKLNIYILEKKNSWKTKSILIAVKILLKSVVLISITGFIIVQWMKSCSCFQSRSACSLRMKRNDKVLSNGLTSNFQNFMVLLKRFLLPYCITTSCSIF